MELLRSDIVLFIRISNLIMEEKEEIEEIEEIEEEIEKEEKEREKKEKKIWNWTNKRIL